jgi:hypothetical protein
MNILQAIENWSLAQRAFAIGAILIAFALWRFPHAFSSMLRALAKRAGYVSRRSAEEARLERLRNLSPPNRRKRIH